MAIDLDKARADADRLAAHVLNSTDSELVGMVALVGVEVMTLCREVEQLRLLLPT